MKFPVEKLVKLSVAAAAAGATLSLVGCGLGTSASNSAATSLSTISGSVHGGQQPVSGAKVYLYAASFNGYGVTNVSTSLLNNSAGYVTTDSGGNFSITGLYTCPSNAQVYLVARGGNPGLAAGTNNNALTLLAGLGSCSALTASTNITINEVSTVAMTYALAGFMSSSTQVATSSSSAGVAGMARAFATIPNLVNLASGTVLSTTVAGNGIPPILKFNTLADAIAPCVNSTGTDGNCSALFAATTVPGSAAPTDTVTALLSISQHPANNVAQIYNLSTANAPFQPTETATPNDWTAAVSYSGGGLNQAYGVAIDANGNVWFTNPGANTVSEFNYLGAPVQTYTSQNLNNPRGIAIDIPGNVYVTNFGGSTIQRISAAGIQTTFSGGGLANPFGIAIDGNNNVFVGNQGGQSNSASAFFPSGQAMGGSPYVGGGINVPTAVAVDGSGQVFITNASSTISKFTPAGSFYAGNFPATGNGLANPVAIAFDSSSNAFVANGSSSVSRFANDGSALGGSPYTGGGTGVQQGIAIDGDGTAFLSSGTQGIKVLLNAGGTAKSPSNGFTNNRLNGPAQVAVDGSGNLWVANNGSGATTVSEFIGLGAPTYQPLANQVGFGFLGKRP